MINTNITSRYIVLASFVFISANALAAGPDFHVGVQAEYVSYDEPRVMQEKGLLGGIFADCDMPLTDRLSCRAFSSYVYGELDYSTHSEYIVDLEFTTEDTIFDVRGEVGYELQCKNMTFKPYLGFAYRNLEDKLPDYRKYVGYARKQIHWYVPLGLDLDLPAADKWDCSMRLEYDYFIEGENRVNEEVLEQEDGWGCRGSLSMVRTDDLWIFNELTIEPFFQYWHLDRSKPSQSHLYEPRNTSTMIGARVAVAL